MSTFLERLSRAPILVDGAMGTMIHSRGIGFEVNFDSLNLLRPELIKDIHREYVAAGADVIETNTFGANRFRFEAMSVLEGVADVNARGVELARQAARDVGGREVLIAGSVGPSGAQLAPLGGLSPAEALAGFREQVEALADAGADLIILETFSDLAEIELALRAAMAVCKLPIVAQMTFTRDERTVMGSSPEDAAHRLHELGADVVGANCSTGPRSMQNVTRRMLAELRGAGHADALVSAMPNAGFPEVVGGRVMYPATPEYFGEASIRFNELGVRLVGGCCGTTPRHTRAMRAAIDALNGAAPARVSISVPALPHRPAPSAPAAAGRATQIETALSAGTFVATVEVEPPKSHDTQPIEEVATMLAQAGANVLDISDLPMARLRMSALALATRVQERVGIETVLHFPVRGRNLLRVQGDLLAAHALSIRMVFVTMGDPTAIGDYPQAQDLHDIVPTGLTQLIKDRLNQGVDSAGASIGRPCSFFVGVAANLTPTDVDKEARLLRKKVEAGADFALTQPVFDAELARAFVARYEQLFGPLTLPILAGMLPLASVRHAEFLKNEVPGVRLPDALIDRLRGAGVKTRTEGALIASELVERLRADMPSVIRGVYFIPAFGRYDVIARLIERL